LKHTIRRLAAVASVTALAAAFAAGPASADLETFSGTATARGLNISVANPLNNSKVQATLGAASATADSSLKATATGQGEIVPLNLAKVKTASASTSTPTVDAGQGCADPVNLLDVVSLDLACGQAKASVAGNLPVATSEGSIAGLGVDGETALSKLTSVVPVDIGGTLSSALNTVCTTLSASCPATTTINDLVQSVLKTKTLDVSIGKSNSSVTTTASQVVSTSTASGAVIKILPLPQVNGLPSTDPIATITISSATATATYDRIKGVSTSSVDPALVRVDLNPTLAQTLGVPQETNLTVGKDTTILPYPLTSTITVASGTQTADAKSASAVADGVKLHLLEGLGESKANALDCGITIELAHAEAGVAGAPAVVTPAVPTIKADTPRELPRTGGNPFIPLAGVVVLAAAVITRRTWLKASAEK